MAQLVEHILGKDEVPGPNPGSSSKQKRHSTRSVSFVYCYSRFGPRSASATRVAESGSVSPLKRRGSLLTRAKRANFRRRRISETLHTECLFCLLLLSLRAAIRKRSARSGIRFCSRAEGSYHCRRQYHAELCEAYHAELCEAYHAP